jgi:hypothetical protein
MKDFGTYAERTTKELKAHLEKIASEAGRPYPYLPSGQEPQGESKEEMARQLLSANKKVL